MGVEEQIVQPARLVRALGVVAGRLVQAAVEQEALDDLDTCAGIRQGAAPAADRQQHVVAEHELSALRVQARVAGILVEVGRHGVGQPPVIADRSRAAGSLAQ